MVAIGQTITIVNQSGKVVKTSKHLVNVWKEAKAAYNEKKAEIKALRKDDLEVGDKEQKTRRRLEALALEDDAVSRSSSRRSSRHRREEGSQGSRRAEHRTERPPVERGYSDSFYANDLPLAPRTHRPSPLRRGSSDVFRNDEPRVGELARRHTENLQLRSHRPTTPTRRASLDDIDMDLAYGELPPPLPERKYDTEVEIRSKMSGLQRLLDEGNCIQHSVTATIDNLQKNPEALAAVALALGEISNLATKLAPGALMSMKSSFPAIIALLASPQFAIAVGVGVGVTVIMFGGYKIIKKIKANKEAAQLLENGGRVIPSAALRNEPESPASEMDELRELSSIERWRRGIADVEAESAGTSVEGEFITPVATRTLIEEGKLTEADLKSTVSGGKKKHRRRSKSEHSAGGSSTKSRSKSGEKVKAKKKEPSGLRMLFKSHAHA
jgi:hypothetical protein